MKGKQGSSHKTKGEMISQVRKGLGRPNLDRSGYEKPTLMGGRKDKKK